MGSTSSRSLMSHRQPRAHKSTARLRLRWKKLESLLCAPNQHAPGMIQIQNRNGRSPLGCHSDDAIFFEAKMFVPSHLPRIKKHRQYTAFRVDCVNPIRLVKIARRTAPREIVQLCRPAPRFGRNMFDMECRSLQRLIHPAIFTSVPRTHSDLISQFAAPIHCGLRPSR